MKLFITSCIILFSLSFCYGQKGNPLVKGIIANYANQPLSIYKCYGDTLLLADSAHTGKKGEFTFSITDKRIQRAKLITEHPAGMYKIVLQRNQFFYILYYGHTVEIKTLYQFNAFYNIATDSLVVLKSDENKRFYEFQHLQEPINIANYWLMQMMRLYPLPDPFHKQIEAEYFSRYNAMEQFVKKEINDSSKSMAAKVALAYYQPVNPDWKQPDPWRDSIIAAHYFDYFNPADSFYMNTNILQEKIDLFLTLSTDKRDKYGQPVKDEMLEAIGVQKFLDKTKSNETNFDFYLQKLLKKYKKDHKEKTFLYLYDLYLKPKEGDCETENTQYDWARAIANKLRNVSIGSTAPDFAISENLQLSGIQSDYTLVLFWASWCPHCTEAVPEIKKAADEFNKKGEKKLITVAVSLDTDKEQWQKFITENKLSSFLNFSELKGWKSEVIKKYNVHATPTMFLLDKDKKIIAKPETAQQLIRTIGTIH